MAHVMAHLWRTESAPGMGLRHKPVQPAVYGAPSPILGEFMAQFMAQYGARLMAHLMAQLSFVRLAG
jgi:hypothetical protein